tara:strand:- start:2591 stop:2902 length:312 start_codon:yes stop_codon:yes gene_type:complete
MLKKKPLYYYLQLLLHERLPQKKRNKKEKKFKQQELKNPLLLRGVLNNDAWRNAELISDFVTFRPDDGKTVAAEYQTTVKVIYDDDAIYISATMLDPKNIPSL